MMSTPEERMKKENIACSFLQILKNLSPFIYSIHPFKAAGPLTPLINISPAGPVAGIFTRLHN